MHTLRLLLAIGLYLSTYDVSYAQDEDVDDVYDWGTVYYGVKGGVGLNNQNWQSGISRGLIFTPTIDFFAESYDPGSVSRLYAQVGYHQRGSALGANGLRRVATYRYHNAAVEIGGRRRALTTESYDGYYILGLRAEYTLGTNIGSSQSLYTLLDELYVRKFNYGVTVGGGFEYDLGDGTSIFLEVAFSPDLSAQYDQTVTLQFLNPFPTQTSNQFITIPQQQVRNYGLEVKVGYKWLR